MFSLHRPEPLRSSIGNTIAISSQHPGNGPFISPCQASRVPILILLLLILVACSEAPPPKPVPPASQPMRLASWNVQNLFDEVDDPNNDEVPSPQEVKSKLARLAFVLKRLEADVIGLQEVENEEILERLAQELPGYRPILIEGNDHRRGIDVALLTRRPVEHIRSHSHRLLPYVTGTPKNYKFSRDCLEVEIGGELPVTVLVNHFISNRNPGATADAKRRAQAMGVAQIVAEREGRLVAVLGDLNESFDSWSLEPLADLVDPFHGLPERHTYLYRGRPLVLDHILPNRALSSRVVEGSPKVWRKGVKQASDHFPITLDLR